MVPTDYAEGTSQPATWLVAFAEPATVAVCLLYLLYQFFVSHVEGDQAYLLYAAQQVLHGAQLDGATLVETNPPLIVWFSMVPARLGALLHIDAVTVLRAVVTGMLMASAAWGWRLLRLARLPALFGTAGARALWALTFLLVLLTRPAEFGQREQLLLILFMPYLLAVGSGVVAKLAVAERIALGLCAGLAICFKPQHLLTLICFELFLAFYARTLQRLRSRELLTLVGTGLLYVAAVRVLTPAYLLVIVPLLRDTYWALGSYSTAEMVLGVGRFLTCVTCAGAIVWYYMRGRLALRRLEGSMLAASGGAVLVYFQQHTGWYHQRFTAEALLEISVLWIVVDRSRNYLAKAGAEPRLTLAAWAVLPVCGVLLFAAAREVKRRHPPRAGDMQAELMRLPPRTTVYAFTVGMTAFPAVVERNLVWGGRYAHLWLLPAILANEDAKVATPAQVLTAPRLTELGALLRRNTTADLLRTAPAVMFVERCEQPDVCPIYGAPFSTIGWFSRDPAFAAMWSHYHFLKTLRDYDMYQRTR